MAWFFITLFENNKLHKVLADLIDSDFQLYGKDGQALTLTGSPLSYDSTTVELDWPDESNRVNIMKRVLVMCGVSAPDQLAIQYGAQWHGDSG